MQAIKQVQIIKFLLLFSKRSPGYFFKKTDQKCPVTLAITRRSVGGPAVRGRGATLSEPFDLDGHQACIGASIGIALGPQDGANGGARQGFAGSIIPLAEETGLIIRIGAWVLETACREAASWPRPYRVAVNVSPRQLARADFATFVADVLRRTGPDPGRLEIEITETMLIKDADAAMAMLQRFKDQGVKIALDDFGTGYSSLSYLAALSV